MHESKYYDDNCFITLTYREEDLPYGGTLDHKDWQLFMKRLRSKTKHKFKFFMCGEYGDKFGRPHYHAILFNYDFKDKRYSRTTDKGYKVYTSDLLDSTWQKGKTEIGSVTHESAGYVASYCTKVVSGDKADEHYRVCVDGNVIHRLPEYGRCSNGIGERFVLDYKSDIYPRDFVLKNGAKVKTPRYYDKVLAKTDPKLLKEIEKKRKTRERSKRDESFRKFLAREEITLAKLQLRSA
jgi:hypothetical protein